MKKKQQTEEEPCRYTCCWCNARLVEDKLGEEDYCEKCLAEVNDILYSEEARYYGSPYKLQVWSDERTVDKGEGFGEVEVTCVNYSTVGFRDLRTNKTKYIRKEDFCRRFSFVRTVY